MTEERYDHIMVSLRANRNMVERGRKLGLPYVFRTKQQQKELTALYAAKAGEAKAFRLEREDTAGNPQADGGNLVFGRNGQENIHLWSLLDDLSKAGYGLTIAEVFQKESDSNGVGFIRFVFTHDKAVVMPTFFEVSEEQERFMTLLFKRLYRKVHGFRNNAAVSLEGEQNPIQGPIITLNVAGPVTEARELEERRPYRRDLRLLDELGHFRCPLHDSQAHALAKKQKASVQAPA
ncbi:MAG: hypothetical protein PHT51_01495 [Patescibacteria group bacterium]|nr:hypothetical protein [Patescibacteria group bacterium]